MRRSLNAFVSRRRCGRIGLALLPILGWSLAGCSGTHQGPGDRLLREGDYAAAVKVYEIAEQQAPNDPRTKRNLGIALHEDGRHAEAIEKLEQALALDPRDARAVFFLAQSYDSTGAPDRALETYTAYLAMDGKEVRAARARVRALTLEKMRREIRWALDREDSLSAKRVANSLAVPDFVNLSGREDLRPLAKGLAAVLISDLSKVEQFRIVERQRIQILLDETDLASPGAAPKTPSDPIGTIAGIKERLRMLCRPATQRPYYDGPTDYARDSTFVAAVRAFQNDERLVVDGIPGDRTKEALRAALVEPHRLCPSACAQSVVHPATAPRFGSLLGAQHLVQGAFVLLGESDIQLHGRAISTTTGEEVPVGEPVEGRLESVLRLEKALVYHILDLFGVEPTDREREAIDQLPTQDFQAFLAYGRGLYLEDQGDLSNALASYGEALQLDPDFSAAGQARDVLAVSPADLQQSKQAEVRESTKPWVGRPSRDLTDDIAVDNGSGPPPDERQRDADDPASVERVHPGELDPSPPDADKVGTEEQSIPPFPPPPQGGPR